MTRATETSDDEIVVRLGTMYRSAEEQARHDVLAVPINTSTRRRTKLLGRAAIISAVAVVALVYGLPLMVSGLGSQGATALPSPIITPSRPSATPGSTPSPAMSVLLQAGIPVRLNGEAVLTAAAALAAVQGSTDDHSILIGGWLHGGGQPMSCPVKPGPWNPCIAMQLYAARVGGTALFVYPATATPPIDTLTSDEVRAIVVRAHTHDRGCAAQTDGCLLLPVLDLVQWLGPIEPAAPIPAAAVTPPPGGLSRSTAVAKAEGYLAANASNTATVRSATAGQYAAVGGGGAGVAADRWVWAIVFDGSFQPAACSPPGESSPMPCGRPASTELVVVDYLDGTFLKAEAPAPTRTP